MVVRLLGLLVDGLIQVVDRVEGRAIGGEAGDVDEDTNIEWNLIREQWRPTGRKEERELEVVDEEDGTGRRRRGREAGGGGGSGRTGGKMAGTRTG